MKAILALSLVAWAIVATDGSPTPSYDDSIDTSKSSYVVGEGIDVTFTVDGPQARDWIAIYEEVPDLHKDPLLWVYTCGGQFCSSPTVSGSFTFDDATEVGEREEFPLGAGSYRAVLARGSWPPPYTDLAVSEVFHVVEHPPTPVAAPSAAPVEAPTAAPVEAPTTSPVEAPTVAPVAPPSAAPVEDPTVAPVMAPSPAYHSVDTDKDCYLVDEDIEVSFTIASPHPYDWIAIYESPVEDFLHLQPLLWVYACGDQYCSSPTGSGSVIFGSGPPDEGQRTEFPLGPGVYTAITARGSNPPFTPLAVCDVFVVTAGSCDSEAPVEAPSAAPVEDPSAAPVEAPTAAPVAPPSAAPVENPTAAPVDDPTVAPVMAPSPAYHSVDTDKDCYLVDEDIEVSFTIASPHPYDWIAIYESPVEDFLHLQPLLWVYACGDQYCSSPTGSGTVTFGSGPPDEGQRTEFPLVPGVYTAITARGSNPPFTPLAVCDVFVVTAGSCDTSSPVTAPTTGPTMMPVHVPVAMPTHVPYPMPTHAPLATPSPVTATIDTDEDCYAVGQDIAVSFFDSHPQAHDWIAVYYDSVDVNNLAGQSLLWLYTCGTQGCSGAVSGGTLVFGFGDPDESSDLSFPLPAGNYVAILVRSPYDVLAVSDSFEITESGCSTPTVSAPPTPNPTTELPMEMPTTGPTPYPATNSPTETPSAGITTMPVYAPYATPTLSPVGIVTASVDTDEECYAVGQDIAVSFFDSHPQAHDWIAIYYDSVDVNNLAGQSLLWLYTCGTKGCSGAVSGGTLVFGFGDPDESSDLSFPLPAGNYVAILVRSPYDVLAVSDSFEITESGCSTPSVSAPPTPNPTTESPTEMPTTGPTPIEAPVAVPTTPPTSMPVHAPVVVPSTGPTSMPIHAPYATPTHMPVSPPSPSTVTVDTNEGCYHTGEDIDVSFFDTHAQSRDWVGIYYDSVDVNNFAGQSLLWLYTCGTQGCSGAVSGDTLVFGSGDPDESSDLSFPLPAGRYIAILARNPYVALAISESFEITESGCPTPSAPTPYPTSTLTGSPTTLPTDGPTSMPTGSPTAPPTKAPTSIPTGSPTATPTKAPTSTPTGNPTSAPTKAPTSNPTRHPTFFPAPTGKGKGKGSRRVY